MADQHPRSDTGCRWRSSCKAQADHIGGGGQNSGRPQGVCSRQGEHDRAGQQLRRRTETSPVFTIGLGLAERRPRCRRDDAKFARQMRDRTLAARERRPVSSTRQTLGQERQGDDNSERQRGHRRPADQSVPQHTHRNAPIGELYSSTANHPLHACAPNTGQERTATPRGARSCRSPPLSDRHRSRNAAIAPPGLWARTHRGGSSKARKRRGRHRCCSPRPRQCRRFARSPCTAQRYSNASLTRRAVAEGRSDGSGSVALGTVHGVCWWMKVLSAST